MSTWKEKLENIKFSITTGDGKTYYPLWIRGEKGKEFNAAIYDFIDVPGSYVDRKNPQSNKYPLIFFFQGDDNIEQADAFEKSANDPRAWEVKHPFYGSINGQPTTLTRNDESYNVTQIKVDFWESVTEDYPESDISIKDRVNLKKANVLQSAGVSYLSGAKPKSSDVLKIKEVSNQTQGSFAKLLDNDTKITYQNAYSKSLKATDSLLSDSSTAYYSTQDLVNLPATFPKPVLSRIKSFKNAYESIKGILSDRNSKYYYESQAGSCLANACNASVNPINEDYVTREEVNEVSEILLQIYADYLATLDENQVDQYNIENSWSPDSELQMELYDLMSETISDLYVLAFNAKQERIVYAEKDTNLFLLVHKYMGLDLADENLENFRKINNIKNDELLVVRKERKLKYYV